MSRRKAPQTTTVGSYPVPAWLQHQGTKANLRDAIMVVFKTQELAGIDLVVDGELYRWDINHPETNGMIDFFIRPMSGVDIEFSRAHLEQFRKQNAHLSYRAVPAGRVTGPVGSGSLNLLSDYQFLRPLTKAPLKFTITSPYMLSRVLLDSHYGDRESLLFAIADVLADQLAGLEADVIQVDEANVTGNPEDWEMAVAAINRVFSKVPKSTIRAVHMCFGNYGGQTVQQGTYSKLIKFINTLECDHMVLEMARRPVEEEIFLKEVKPEMGIGLGVIDIKDNQVESADDVARRIERAAGLAGESRIQYVHPDCGLWMLPRSVADAKLGAMVQGRNLYWDQT